MNKLPDIAENLIKQTRSELLAHGCDFKSAVSFENWMTGEIQQLLGLKVTARDYATEQPKPVDIMRGNGNQYPMDEYGGYRGDAAGLTQRIVGAYKRGGGRVRSDRAG